MPEDTFKITIDGTPYTLDDLTLSEVEQLEEAFDKPLGEIDMSRAKALRYLLYFARRHTDPGFTLEAAGEINLTALAEPPASPPTKRPTRAAKGG